METNLIIKRCATIAVWIISLILPNGLAYSQNGMVGIGTDTPAAALDVDVSDNGLLIPRVALIDRNTASPLTSPTVSEMVYNTTTGGTPNVWPGYYYWNGGAWVRLRTQGDNLGNHIAEENLQMSGHWISNDGDDEGLFVNQAGRVGIGISSPSFQMQIVSSNADALRLQNQNVGSGSGTDTRMAIVGARSGCTTCKTAELELKNYDSDETGDEESTMASIVGAQDKTSLNRGKLMFYVNEGNNAGGLIERMRISSDGIVNVNSLANIAESDALVLTDSLGNLSRTTDIIDFIKAGNGLHTDLALGEVHLGGTLQEATTVDLVNHDMTFDITGSGDFRLKNAAGVTFRHTAPGFTRVANEIDIRKGNINGGGLLVLGEYGSTSTGWIRVAGTTGASAIEMNGFDGSVFNNANQDHDFHVKTANQDNTLFVNGGTDRVGIGMNDPEVELEVAGTVMARSFLYTNARSVKQNNGNYSNQTVTASCPSNYVIKGLSMASGPNQMNLNKAQGLTIWCVNMLGRFAASNYWTTTVDILSGVSGLPFGNSVKTISASCNASNREVMTGIRFYVNSNGHVMVTPNNSPANSTTNLLDIRCRSLASNLVFVEDAVVINSANSIGFDEYQLGASCPFGMFAHKLTGVTTSSNNWKMEEVFNLHCALVTGE